jgi:hypothetical protein
MENQEAMNHNTGQFDIFESYYQRLKRSVSKKASELAIKHGLLDRREPIIGDDGNLLIIDPRDTEVIGDIEDGSIFMVVQKPLIDGEEPKIIDVNEPYAQTLINRGYPHDLI